MEFAVEVVLRVVILEQEGTCREKVTLTVGGISKAARVVPSLFKVPALCEQWCNSVKSSDVTLLYS